MTEIKDKQVKHRGFEPALRTCTPAPYVPTQPHMTNVLT